MNAKQLKEKWMQFKCALKQQWSNFIDDDIQESELHQDFRHAPRAVRSSIQMISACR